MSADPQQNGDGALVEIQSLKKYFPIRKGVLQREVERVHAVDDVTLSVAKGETVGLVGESGCGKSTLGRCVVRLLTPTEGDIVFQGTSIGRLGPRALRPLRREMQMVFQDPYASLNPRKRVGSIVGDPLKIHGIGNSKERKTQVEELLETVGLSPEHYNRFPHEFSGGQRQRIGVARALALRPKLIVADEPVSALDVSIQAQILVLLRRLQERRNLGFVFISHDLGVVRHFCRSVAVMYLGRIVERGPVPAIFDEPLHPYTRALRNASPVPDPKAKVQMAKLEGEVASALSPPSGCHFHPRCPQATAICRSTYPSWVQVAPDRGVACHLYPPQAGAT